MMKKMLRYHTLKTKPQKFLKLTGATLEEFLSLLPGFEKAYLEKFPTSKTMTGETRKRLTGAGRRGPLSTMEQKLLFILVYQNGHPLQWLMGKLFGISQGRANAWIHRLQPILIEVLNDKKSLIELESIEPQTEAIEWNHLAISIIET